MDLRWQIFPKCNFHAELCLETHGLLRVQPCLNILSKLGLGRFKDRRDVAQSLSLINWQLENSWRCSKEIVHFKIISVIMAHFHSIDR